MRNLRGFLIAGAVAGAIVMTAFLYLAMSQAYVGFVRRDVEQRARSLAETISNMSYQQMAKGWTKEDLEAYLEVNKEVWDRVRVDVRVYYRPDGAGSGGSGGAPDAALLEVFRSGRADTVRQGAVVRYLYPQKAEKACLTCHESAAPGEVLGVVEVREDLGPVLAEARRRTVTYLALLAPLPVCGAYLVAALLGRRLRRCTNRLQDRVAAVNRLEDLKTLEVEDADFVFDEFNHLYAELRKLTQRIRQIAVDRDILEFQVRLLEKLVITSDVVKEWQEYVKGLLVQINAIVPAPVLFAVFRVSDEDYDVQVFWLYSPGEKTKKAFEEVIIKKLRSSPLFGGVLAEEVPSLVHHVAGQSFPPEELEAAVKFHTKALILDKPSIGGIVGIGVNSALVTSPTGSLVLESILTTLLNVIGSVKAIYKYTRDLEYYATRDPLTGLYTQRVFWELLEYEVERAKRHDCRFAVLVLDLDNFKTINDLYGHLVGDNVLRAVAQVFKSSLRREDVVARYGGDEYAAILPLADQEQAYLAAKRAQERIRQFSYLTQAGEPVRVSTSIGIAVFPEHGGDAKTLFTVADNMLYKAKSSGKDKVWVPTNEDVAGVLRTLADKRALVSDALAEGRVIPYFQPIVNLGTGKIEAYEVLMRIKLPERIMAASEFIETAAEMGMINRLDLLIAEKALAAAKEYGYAGLLFLNVSPRALVADEFIAAVGQLVGKYGFDPARLVLELTERETVANFDLLEGLVFALKEQGFKFAVDDFGSGFSSFWYIRRLPIDFLKIEGEFIRHMADGEQADLAIVSCIVTLANNLGIRTVAEHVESEAIYRAAARLGIDYAQGYYSGRPSPSLGSAS